MSFGFGVGDFIAVFKLVNKARKRFVDAPHQYDAISEDLRKLSNVVQDVEILLSGWEPQTRERERLQEIADDSTRLVNELISRLDKYQEIGASNSTMAQRSKRAIKIVGWDQNDVQELRERISLLLNQLIYFEGKLSSQRTGRMEHAIHQLSERSNQQERDDILNWIGAAGDGGRQSSHYGKREPGTGEWFISSEKFQRWMGFKDGLLFCPGRPGAGKTILASIAIHHLLNHFGSDRDTGIAYHYCDFQQEGETFDVILSSILRQFAECSASLPDDIQTLYNKYKDKSGRPESEEISNTLETVASMYSRCFIVIDGLDECAAGSDVVAYLRRLPGANILVTCRDYPDIVDDLESKGGVKLEVRATDADVRRYLDRKLRRLDRVIKHDQELRKNILDAILAASGGMFLLARLHVESLAGMMSIRAVKNAVAAFPTDTSTYDDAYDKTMKRIERQPGEQAAKAKDVLAWLTFAKRPLRVEELPTAIIVQETDKDLDEERLIEIDYLASVCAGLVDIRNGSVTLIHSTTKEYLKQRLANWRQNPDAAIATACLTYLSFPTFDVDFSKLQEYLEREQAEMELYPMLEYSMDYIAPHVRLAMTNVPCVNSFFLSYSKIASNWLLLKAKHGDEQAESTAEWLIEQGVCTNVHDPKRRTPLHYAVLNGWKRCVQLLLERGATLQADVGNMTPLHYTVKADAEEIAQIFFDAGISVDTPVTRQTWMPRFQDGQHVYVRERSELSLAPNSNTNEGLTPLHLAALAGSQRMTKFLLDRGANPNFPSTSGETPLHLALKLSTYGPEWPGIVDFWSEPDNRIECILDYIGFNGAEDEEDFSSSHEWIRETRLAIIDLLLESPGVDVSVQDNFGISPLHIAARRNYTFDSVAEKLMKKGAVISLCTNKNEIPLHFAVASRNGDFVSRLLNLGTNPADQDVDGLNAFHYAAREGQLPIFEEMLSHIPAYATQAILESKDNSGRNILHHLLDHGFVDIAFVRYLLERVSGINDLDNEGMNPMAVFLSASALCEHQDNREILDLLFEHGADPSFTTAGGLNLGHLVAGSHRASDIVLRTLARWGVNLTSRDEQSRTALHYACIKGSLTEKVLCFLHKEVKLPLDIRDKHGKTALDYAIEKGKEDHGPNLFKPRRWKETERLLRGMEKEV